MAGWMDGQMEVEIYSIRVGPKQSFSNQDVYIWGYLLSLIPFNCLDIVAFLSLDMLQALFFLLFLITFFFSSVLLSDYLVWSVSKRGFMCHVFKIACIFYQIIFFSHCFIPQKWLIWGFQESYYKKKIFFCRRLLDLKKKKKPIKHLPPLPGAKADPEQYFVPIIWTAT